MTAQLDIFDEVEHQVAAHSLTPYYQGERATLYLGDCRELAGRLGRAQWI
jgi:hypothetical protein